jgi:hypothetical protein
VPATITYQGAGRDVITNSLTEVLAPDSSLLISVGDPTAANQIGWAAVLSSAPIGGYAIFRAISGTGPPAEASVPLQTQLPASVTFPFDNTAGLVTSVGLANPGVGAATVTATMWDDSGNLFGTKTIAVGVGGHTAFALPDRLVVTAGQRGIVRFQSSAPEGIAGLGLRFSPSGFFTFVPAM